jgi:putative DNA primase/helicase
MQDLSNYFLDFITATGISAPRCIIPDGQIHRFYNGKRSSKTGWYVFNGFAGAVGDWRTGEKHRFYPKDIQALEVDLTELGKRAERLNTQRENEIRAQHAQAKLVAKAVWENSIEVSIHPYLINKSVKSYGLRERCTGELIVPGYNVLDELTTLQFITVKGNKKFLPGSQASGSYFVIGLINDVLCIAEGYATAATIHTATGYAVAVAFNDSNLGKITRICRLKYPKVKKLIVCADDDFETAGNPGLTKARQAAIENHAYLTVPLFHSTRPSKATDFNDMSKIYGNESVKEAIYHAKQI